MPTPWERDSFFIIWEKQYKETPRLNHKTQPLVHPLSFTEEMREPIEKSQRMNKTRHKPEPKRKRLHPYEPCETHMKTSPCIFPLSLRRLSLCHTEDHKAWPLIHTQRALPNYIEVSSCKIEVTKDCNSPAPLSSYHRVIPMQSFMFPPKSMNHTGIWTNPNNKKFSICPFVPYLFNAFQSTKVPNY